MRLCYIAAVGVALLSVVVAHNGPTPLEKRLEKWALKNPADIQAQRILGTQKGVSRRLIRKLGEGRRSLAAFTGVSFRDVLSLLRSSARRFCQRAHLAGFLCMFYQHSLTRN